MANYSFLMFQGLSEFGFLVLSIVSLRPEYMSVGLDFTELSMRIELGEIQIIPYSNAIFCFAVVMVAVIFFVSSFNHVLEKSLFEK